MRRRSRIHVTALDSHLFRDDVRWQARSLTLSNNLTKRQLGSSKLRVSLFTSANGTTL